MKAIALTLLLTGCAAYPMIAPPTPAQCRDANVAVEDGAEITGRIVNVYFADACFEGAAGHAKKVGAHEYEICLATDDERVNREEACHALYEQPNHTEER